MVSILDVTKVQNKTTNEHYRKTYVCNKEGFKCLKVNNSSGKVIKRRREVRTGCKAMIQISKQKDEKWIVDKFNDKHNHALSLTPTKVMKNRSHGKFHRTMKCRSLMVQFGQADEADVTSKQCADVLSEQRKQYMGKEFYGLIKHFQDKELVDNDQYFVVDLCDDV
ncbi:protein FAR1-RELATED SEQUENCE 5-like [Lactuca sativa]|uniref:protein FAR1-RELATED SEQUENCE 5-like n=1 Tax=Lactuca sativa TaxID=4236 RepID=UPI001C68D4A5|nr:protein FAR1-RELATED SEQUENCE 5-like [Lactuca sativa]